MSGRKTFPSRLTAALGIFSSSLFAQSVAPALATTSAAIDEEVVTLLPFQVDGSKPTFDCELTDIEAGCAYGHYFAGKLRGGVALATARAKGDAKQQDIAVAALENALVHWKRLAELGAKFNQLPILSNSSAPFSWASLTPTVEKDIEIAKAPLASASPP